MGSAVHSLVQEEIIHRCFISLSQLLHTGMMLFCRLQNRLYFGIGFLCENFVHVLLTAQGTGFAAGGRDVRAMGKLLKAFTC